jgi:pimeloyl-ACP methyl ester carboxylesterase
MGIPFRQIAADVRSRARGWWEGRRSLRLPNGAGLLEPRYVKIDSVPIHYHVAGQGDALVLVHGLSGSTRWWKYNIAVLAEHYTVYGIDLIGFGQSRGRHRFVLSDAATYIVRWMDQIGVERATFIGHSMGGYIVADLAADYPERVDRLVLVNAAGLPFSRNYLQHALGLVRALRFLPFNFLPVLVADSLGAGLLNLWRAGREILRSELTEKLAQIRAPTLVVWGEHDTLIPLQWGRRFVEFISDVRFVVVEGAGHNPMWDRADVFNQVILDFLTSPQHEAEGEVPTE